MKKTLTAFAIIMALILPVFVESAPLLPASFVEVDNGNLAENTLLASNEGNVFVEFSKETKFVDAEGKTSFTGEILPPQKIEFEFKKPRGMMRELVTFEMVSNTGADVIFIDKFDKRTRKNLFREQLLNPDGLEKSAWVKLIYLIDNEDVNLPKLWEWQGEDLGWKKIGGNLTEAGENSRILSAILRRTGIYTVFDEDPVPEHFADEYEVYPKRPYTGPYAEETEEPATISDEEYGVEADFGFETSEEENFAGFHSSGEPPTLNEEVEIPAVQAEGNTQVLQDLQKKIAENSAKLKANPEMEKKVNDLVKLIQENSAKKQKIDKLNAELNTISFALSRSTNENEKKNLEKTFLELQTELYKLQKEDKEKEAQFLTLKEEVDDFFAGISLSEIASNTSANSFDEPETNSEEAVYIPENATLVQSGAEDSQNISWGFPVFLFVCFGLLGWGIWSTKKKEV